MITTYERFVPHRPLEQYAGQAGDDIGGLALSPAAYAALAESKMTGQPCELVVVGAWKREDGARFLDFAVTTHYIESVTDFRFDANQHRLRSVCPRCDLKDGKHTKACDR